MTPLAATAMFLIGLSAALLYLGSPNQLLYLGALPRRSIAIAGPGLAVLGLVLLLQWAGPATSVFIAFTIIMLVWLIVPLVAAWFRGDRKAEK